MEAKLLNLWSWYNYHSARQQLVVCMPHAIHEIFIHIIELKIMTQLEAILAHGNILELFTGQIFPSGSTSLTWKSEELKKIIKHNPDASYIHKAAAYPGVIIEVSYSQKRKDLSKLASDYILESETSVQLVI